MKERHGGNIWSVSEKTGIAPEKIIDFSASISPIPIKNIDQDLKGCIKKIGSYPDSSYSELRRSIGKYLDISSENILVGNGSTEFIYLLPLLLKPQRVFIPAPSFSEYSKAAKISGAEINILTSRKKDSFKIPLKKLMMAVNENDLVILANPSSPVGSMLKNEELCDFVRVCEKKKAWLVIDEVFIDFVSGWQRETFVSKALQSRYLIVLRSFTKFFAIPGLRLGYVAANKKLIKMISDFQPPWTVNAIAEHTVIRLSKDHNLIAKTITLIEKERKFFYDSIEKNKCLKIFPSVANFFLLEILSSRIDAPLLNTLLIKKGILIRDCSNFKGLNKQFFRVSLRNRKENQTLIEALNSLITLK